MPKGWMILSVGAVAMTALLLVFCWQLYKLAIHRNRKTFLASDPNMPKVEEDEAVREIREWYRSQPFEEVSIRSHDGLTLRGDYLEAAEPTGQAAILAHGYSGQRGDMAAFARFYRELGFNVLLPDSRGHGSSDGHYIGFGWHDRKDYARWVEYLVGRIGPGARIVLHGVSMGGGTVLMASGEPLPEQVKCIISDCAYSSVADILKYQLKQMFKLPAFPLIPITSLICKWKAGFFFGEASAVRQVSRAEKPILLIHGDRDTYVPTSMSNDLFGAIRGEKERLIVPGAQHGTSFLVDPHGYRRAVLGFIGRYGFR